MSPVELCSPTGPIAIVDPRFVSQTAITLTLKEKMFTLAGDSFNIKDSNGQTRFSIRGKVFSLREKKVIYDAQGTPILTMKEAMCSCIKAPNQYFSQGNSGKRLYKVVPKMTLFCNGKQVVKAKNLMDGETLTFTIKNNFNGSRGVIYFGNPRHGGYPVAYVSRPLNMKAVFTECRDYNVTIAANMDIAFVLTLAIAIDEKERDR